METIKKHFQFAKDAGLGTTLHIAEVRAAICFLNHANNAIVLDRKELSR